MPTASKRADLQPDFLRFLAAQKPYLQQRNALERCIRDYFEARGYLSVETPIAIAAPAPEAYIEAPSTTLRRFLRPSPELEMKQLLAAGYEKIYQIGSCFREGERGRKHNEEFSLLEWYCTAQTYAQMQRFILGLFEYCASQLPVSKTLQSISLRADDAEIVTVAEAFERYARRDVFACIESGEFEDVLCTLVEPHLGQKSVTLLVDYPASMAAFSRLKPDDPRFAERFEAYINGMELANAYGELTDPVIQRERFAEFDAIRLKNGGKPYPPPRAFLEAIDSGIAPAAGAAMGVDRLAMLFSDAPSIDFVRLIM